MLVSSLPGENTSAKRLKNPRFLRGTTTVSCLTSTRSCTCTSFTIVCPWTAIIFSIFFRNKDAPCSLPAKYKQAAGIPSLTLQQYVDRIYFQELHGVRHQGPQRIHVIMGLIQRTIEVAELVLGHAYQLPQRLALIEQGERIGDKYTFRRA